MGRRNIILIGVTVILAISVGVASFLFLRNTDPEVIPEQDISQLSSPVRDSLPTSGGSGSRTSPLSGGGTEIVPENIPLPPPPENETYALVGNKAKNYAERFGSFSSHGNFANLVSLRSVSTPQMQQWIDGIVIQYATDNLSTTEYSGTLTKALGARVFLADEEQGFAIVEVDTLRREEKGDIVDTYYQTITIEMKQDTGGTWLLDGAYWGDIQ